MKQPLPVVYFSLQTQFENLGDCIINELVIRELARHARVNLIQRRAPTWLLQRLKQLENVELFDSKSQWFGDLFRKLASRSPVVFAFKPGHYIIPNRLKTLAYTSALVAFCGLCRLRGAKIVRSGVSLDRYGALQTALQAILGRLHTSYGVRDQASLEYARQLGASTAHYSPDMAFLLMDAQATTGLELRKPLTADRIRPKLSVSFRHQGWLKEPDSCQHLVEMVTASAQQFQLEPVVVEQVTFDRELANRLAEHLKCESVRFEQTEESVRGIFENYSQSRLVISNRLHSLLFGWTSGSLPIPLIDNTPHSKIIELFKHLGLSELIHFTDDIAHLPAHVSSIVSQEPMWRKRLERVFKDQRIILQEALAGCFSSRDQGSDRAIVES